MKWLITAAVVFAGGWSPFTQADEGRLLTGMEKYSDIRSKHEVSFRRHVLPLASRLGCSSRECHGSFKGQGDFQLSLFGYDFAKDHQAMLGGDEPRVDTKDSRASLILQKPTLQVRHRGKKRMDVDSWEYHVFLKWIESGAMNDEEETGTFDRLEVIPSSIAFGEGDKSVQLKVVAYWQDGTVEDVTDFTRFQTNDESVATIDKNGVVTSVGPGDTHVVAFYDNGVTPVEIIRPWDIDLATNYPEIAANSEVDRHVQTKLQKLGIVPSAVCSDEDFLRRVRVDLTGSLPTGEEALAFIEDPSPNKRLAKVEQLLQSPEYASWWTTKLCDFTGNNQFQMPDRNFRTEFAGQWWEWIHKRVESNVPYDQLVAGIVLAQSRVDTDQKFVEYAKEMSSYVKEEEPKSFADRETMPHFWSRRNIRTPEEKALSFSHSFLGVRIECAQCHKHPFDQWTKQDFDHFKAFFEPVRYGRKVERGKKADPVNFNTLSREIEEAAGYDRTKRTNRRALDQEIKKRAAQGMPVAWQEVFIDPRYGNPAGNKAKNNRRKNQVNKRVLTPKILGGEEVMVNTYSDPREPLMEWMKDPENPYFARSFANRLWAHYFGRGLVEPADDLNLANPAGNEALMEHLEKGFIQSGFDMKWLHREILLSDTYQRSWEPNDSNRLDDKNFSHMNLRRLPAEVVFDGIQRATAPSSHFEHGKAVLKNPAIGPISSTLPRNSRAGVGYSLNVFGKPAREINCDCERNNDPTLLQTIFTRNDPDMLKSIESGSPRAPRWIDELRVQYGGGVKPVVAGNADTRAEANKIRRQLAELQKNKPQVPAEATKAETTSYKKKMAEYRTVTQGLREKLQKLNADRSQNQNRNQNRASTGRGAKAKKGSSNQVPVGRLVNEVFLRALGRHPDDREFQTAIQDINKMEDPIDGVKELLWALLNTKEFMINH